MFAVAVVVAGLCLAAPAQSLDFFGTSFFQPMPQMPSFGSSWRPQAWSGFSANMFAMPAVAAAPTPAPAPAAPMAFMPSLFNLVNSNANSDKPSAWSRTYISYQNDKQAAPVTLVFDSDASTTRAPPATTTLPPVPTAGQPLVDAKPTTKAPSMPFPMIPQMPVFDFKQSQQQQQPMFPSAPSFNPFVGNMIQQKPSQSSNSRSDMNSLFSQPSWFQPMTNFGQMPQMPSSSSGSSSSQNMFGGNSFWQPNQGFFSFNPFQ